MKESTSQDNGLIYKNKCEQHNSVCVCRERETERKRGDNHMMRGAWLQNINYLISLVIIALIERTIWTKILPHPLTPSLCISSLFFFSLMCPSSFCFALRCLQMYLGSSCALVGHFLSWNVTRSTEYANNKTKRN